MKDIIAGLKEPFKIVVVDDDVKITETIRVFLEEEKNIEFDITNDSKQAINFIKKKQPHAVLTDMKMPGLTGLDVLKKSKEINSEIEVILMTAHASTQSAVEAMKHGAYDYIIKPFKIIELKSILNKIAQTRELEQQNRSLQEKLARYEKPKKMVGSSPAAKKLNELIEMVSTNNASILITGESGTGKSLLAESIHKHSNRAKHPFITIECASIPRDLLESELFGYEKGSFTGADRRKIGRMENAHKGTLFLDEIGDMPIDLQAKMLRVLQERELTRVGGSKPIPIDVRIISATNKDLQSMVKTGDFREDLFYRLNVIPVVMPPLRERKEDIPLLVEYIMDRFKQLFPEKSLSPQAMEEITAYDWPGNIRELENSLERSIIFEKSDIINNLLLHEKNDTTIRYLSLDLLRQIPLSPEGVSLEAIERIIMQKALQLSEQSIEKAAQLLSIPLNRAQNLTQ